MHVWAVIFDHFCEQCIYPNVLLVACIRFKNTRVMGLQCTQYKVLYIIIIAIRTRNIRKHWRRLEGDMLNNSIPSARHNYPECSTYVTRATMHSSWNVFLLYFLKTQAFQENFTTRTWDVSIMHTYISCLVGWRLIWRWFAAFVRRWRFTWKQVVLSQVLVSTKYRLNRRNNIESIKSPTSVTVPVEGGNAQEICEFF